MGQFVGQTLAKILCHSVSINVSLTLERYGGPLTESSLTSNDTWDIDDCQTANFSVWRTKARVLVIY